MCDATRSIHTSNGAFSFYQGGDISMKGQLWLSCWVSPKVRRARGFMVIRGSKWGTPYSYGKSSLFDGILNSWTKNGKKVQ